MCLKVVLKEIAVSRCAVCTSTTTRLLRWFGASLSGGSFSSVVATVIPVGAELSWLQPMLYMYVTRCFSDVIRVPFSFCTCFVGFLVPWVSTEEVGLPCTCRQRGRVRKSAEYSYVHLTGTW